MLANRPSDSTARPQRLAARDCRSQAATDRSVFAGIVVRRVAYGPRGFVALGWDDTSQAHANRPVTGQFSADGLSWAQVSGVPIQGTYAYLFATALPMSAWASGWRSRKKRTCPRRPT